MIEHADSILAVALVVVASFGTGLVLQGYMSATAAITALTVVLFISTATAWIRPGE